MKNPLDFFPAKSFRLKPVFFLFFISLLPFLSISCGNRLGTFYFGSYSEAENLFNHGQYERAIQKYQAYVDENPEGHLSIISQYYMARSHAALGHKEEAKEIYQQIIQKYPDVVWARFSETQLKEMESQPLDKKTSIAESKMTSPKL